MRTKRVEIDIPVTTLEHIASAQLKLGIPTTKGTILRLVNEDFAE